MADDIDSLYGAPERDTASRPDTEDSSLSGLYGEAAPGTQPRVTSVSPDIGDVDLDPKELARDAARQAQAAAIQSMQRARAAASAAVARAARFPRPSKRTLLVGAGILALAVAAVLAFEFWPHHAPSAAAPSAPAPAAAVPQPASSTPSTPPTHIYVSPPPAPATPKVAAPVVVAPAVQAKPPVVSAPVAKPAPVMAPVPVAMAPAAVPRVAKPKHLAPPPRKHVMSAQDRANLDKLNAFFGKQGH